MANPKTKAARTDPKHPRSGSSETMLTWAFATDHGVVLPKRSARSKFKVVGNIAKTLAVRPVKVKALLQGYERAWAESRKAGRAVSFQVDVLPDGATTVTELDVVPAERASLPIERGHEPSRDLQSALGAARERGRMRAGELLAGKDMLTAADFARLLGTSRMTVNTKRQAGQVLGLAGAKRGFRFPAWQLDRDGKPYAELPLLLERLRGPWAVYRFLMQRHGALNGLTGREALERGKGRDAIAAAEGIALGDFT